MQDSSTSFDPDACWQAGNVPWTIFAYPSTLADEERLPLDDDAKQFLQQLRSRGCRVGVWQHPEIKDTIYYACAVEDREVVQAEIAALEQQNVVPENFASTRCDELFALAARNT